MVEVDITDLALSEEEATQVFSAVGARCDDDVFSSVLGRCEGWAAAVVLVALSARDGTDPVALTGSHPLVADYLMEEVLGQLDPDSVRFLTESTVLQRFSAATLDEMLGRTDSARRLEQIRGSGNLFVISLDAEGCGTATTVCSATSCGIGCAQPTRFDSGCWPGGPLECWTGRAISMPRWSVPCAPGTAGTPRPWWAARRCGWASTAAADSWPAGWGCWTSAP